MMDQINEILSNMSQEDMNQMKSLADSLLGGNFNMPNPNQQQNNAPPPPPNQDQQQQNYNQYDQGNNNNNQNSYQQNNNDYQYNNQQNNYQQNNNQSSSDSFGDLFGSLDPAMLAKIGAIMGKLNAKKDDDRIRLLKALMPLLSDKRQQRAERAMKFIGIYELLPEIKNLNLF